MSYESEMRERLPKRSHEEEEEDLKFERIQ
jgi:hypothetical protein